MPTRGRRLDGVLALLLASLVSSAPPRLEVSSNDEQRTDLHLFTAAEAGAAMFDVDPDLSSGGQRGVVTGVRVGLRASREPFVLGAARPGLLPSVVLRYDPLARRTDVLGSAAITMNVWRIFIVNGVGYGFSFLDGFPRHELEITTGLATRFGNLWVGVNFDVLMRLGSSGRAMHLYATVGWEFGLPE